MQAMSGVHRPQQQDTPPLQQPGLQSQQLQQSHNVPTSSQELLQQGSGQQGHATAPSAQPPPAPATVDKDKIYQWITELTAVSTRENSLLELRYASLMAIQIV